MHTILVVDDDKQYRELLTEKLVTAGFTVKPAESAQDALAILQKESVDLVLLDLLLPQVDGMTFYYHLRHKLHATVPVIIVTNLTEITSPNDVSAVIIKSNVTLDDVVTKVQEVLSHLSSRTKSTQ